MPLTPWKWEHIAWEETTKEYGYQDRSEVGAFSKVIVICSTCKLPKLKTSVRSMKPPNGYKPVCKNCQAAAMAQHASKKMKEVWEREGYRDNQSIKHSESSKEKWLDDEYRRKVSDGISRAHRNIDGYTNATTGSLQTPEAVRRRLEVQRSVAFREQMRAALLAIKQETVDRNRTLWQDDDFRRRVTESNREAWRDVELLQQASEAAKLRWEEGRDKYITAFNKPEHLELLRVNSLLLWQDREYKTKSLEARRRPEYLEMAAEAARQLWLDGDYREAQAAARASPEYKAGASARSRALWERDDYRQRMAQARANQPRVSGLQSTLYRLLADLNVPFIPEGPGTAIGHYVFDCLVPKRGGGGVLIECQGEYWHTLPGVPERDRSKFTYIDRHFPEYEVMYLWEHEFSTNERVLERLKSKLGIQTPLVEFDFRDVEVREVDSQDVKEFLDAYHYIGKGRGGVSYGAYHGGELIGVAVYSPPLRQNTAGQFDVESGDCRELSRFCIHPSYQKKNFASWLISKTLKRIESSLVVAYADATAGHRGTIYVAAGFELHHLVSPDYWYVDPDGFVMHKRTLYGRAIRMGMTEREYAERLGYSKRWGGQKHCFIRRMSRHK